MRNEIAYEWFLERHDEYGDIFDTDFSDELTFTRPLSDSIDLGLIRRTGNSSDGEIERLWAYVIDGKLPEYFYLATGSRSTYKVPVRFHTELKNYLNTLKK